MKIDINKLSSPNPVQSAFADLMGVAKKDIQHIDINDLQAYPNQPFKPYSNEKLEELAEDIKMNGILSPIIIRQIENKYQILAGHNRVNAAKLVGLETVPCIVKEADDNTARLILVNTNLNQRQELLPSEKAFAYKIQYDALKSQGKRNDLSSGPMVQKIAISEQSEAIGENARQIRRYIRLTFLIPLLLDMVDKNTLPFRAGVELSYLKEHEQILLYDFISCDGCKISLDKAKEIREISEKDGITDETLLELFCKNKAKQKTSISIPTKKLECFFSANTSESDMLATIIKALEQYNRTKQ